jgi:DNA-binding transcriptional LysR family regulator
LTQPAVTLQIQALEDDLGARLFERRAYGVRITEAGQLLVEYAEQIDRLATEAEGRLAAFEGEVAGDLILGASTTIAQYVLPALLTDFSRAYSGIRLQGFRENTEHVAERGQWPLRIRTNRGTAETTRLEGAAMI